MATKKVARKVFRAGQCHWRTGGLGDREGKPACNRKITLKHANLCNAHEAIWQKAARERYDAKRRAVALEEARAAIAAEAKTAAAA